MKHQINLFSGPQATNEEILRVQAAGWYDHLKNHGLQTGCCIPSLGIYCTTGRDLKQGYLEAAQMAHNHVH
ncbi:MAG: hypothetical protein AB2758_21055 [Candidatus Thiodiazotropha endolucinida]